VGNDHLQPRPRISEGGEVVEFGPYSLQLAERLLLRNGEPVKLGSRSLDLLIALVERAGEVLSRRELLAHAWAGLVVDEANLRVAISNLRKILGDGKDGARYIVNLPGRGYSFVAPVARAQFDLPLRTAATARGSLPSFVIQPPCSSSQHSLPQRLGRLIGRDASVCTLTQLLTEHRFVSVIGPGGMGKTTVAISVAHAMLDAFGGAVYYADLASVNDASAVPSAITAVLGFKARVHDPRSSIRAFFGTRRALLVLDNCEHLIDEVAALAEWIFKLAPQTHLLATSRELLRVEGEHVHILPPLDVPPTTVGITAAEALNFPAVQLFMDRVAASGAQETLTDELAPLTVEICRKMDGIALAIEWAAGRVRSHGLRGTAELIENRFSLLWQGRRSAPPRHQTLQAMLDWSYNLLSETERRVLYRLSVFVAPFKLQAAQFVASNADISEIQVAEGVASLVDKSLLSPSILNGSSQLRLLDTTRAYASTKLIDSGEADSVSQRLARYLIAQLSQDTLGVREGNERNHNVEQVGNLRAALAWAFSNAGDTELGVRLTALAAPQLLELSLLDECYRWCSTALSNLGTHEGSRTHLILQEALVCSALFTGVDRDELCDSIEQGLHLARKFEEHERELELLAGQHIVMCHIGRFREAIKVSWRSLELARKVDSSAGIVMSEWMLGCAYHLAGDQEAALRHIGEGFRQAAARGVSKVDIYGYGHRTRALIVWARALWLNGAADRAAQVARQAVEEVDPDEQPMTMFVALLYASTVFLWRGDVDESEELVGRLNQHARRYSFGTNADFGLALSGEVALLRGDFRTAANRLRTALTTLQTERRQILTNRLGRSLAEAMFECGEIVEAEAMIVGAVEEAEERDDSFDVPELLRTLAQIGRNSGRLDSHACEVMLRHAMEVSNSQGALSLELRSAIALSELYADDGRTDEAFMLLHGVYSRFTEGNETRDLQTAKRLIEAWRPVSGAQSAS